MGGGLTCCAIVQRILNSKHDDERWLLSMPDESISIFIYIS